MPYWRTIIVFVSFLAGVSIIGLYSYPVLQDLKVLREQVVKTKKQKVDLNAEVSRLRAYLTEAEKISTDDRARIDLALPETSEILKLAMDLETLANRNGLLMANITLAEAGLQPTGEPQRGVVTVTMDLRGNYQALKNYLGDIVRDLRILNIEELGFAPDLDLGVASLAASVRVTAYFVSP